MTKIYKLRNRNISIAYGNNVVKLKKINDYGLQFSFFGK